MLEREPQDFSELPAPRFTIIQIHLGSRRSIAFPCFAEWFFQIQNYFITLHLDDGFFSLKNAFSEVDIAYRRVNTAALFI